MIGGREKHAAGPRGGGEAIREKLEAEGHAVIQKGKRFLVDGFEKKTVVPKLK